MKQLFARVLVVAAITVLALKALASGDPIVVLAPNDYIINIDARAYGAPWEGHPLNLVLTLGSGTWLVRPTNPEIDAQAIYTAWSWGSQFSAYWTTHVGVANLATGDQYYRTKGDPRVIYTTQHSAYYDDPLNVPFEMEVTQPTQFAFYTGDSYLGDNAGGASLHVTLEPVVPTEERSWGTIKSSYR